MMNPAIVMTIDEYNVAYMVNEMVNHDGPLEENGLIVDMILTMPQQQLDEVSRIYSEIGLPAFQPEYAQETGEILIDTLFEEIRKYPPIASVVHKTSFAANFLNATDITVAQWRAEVKEMILAESFDGFKEEVSDVLYMSYCLFYQHTGIDLKMRGAQRSVRKFIGRMDQWKDIFDKAGLRFHKWYLSGGSNHHKQEKVNAALERAYREQKVAQSS